MKYDYIIIGGGFRSMCSAFSLLDQGLKVCLLEPSNKLGGFFSPSKWKDYWLDKGPQFFDNFELKDKEFIEKFIGKGVFCDIGFKYGSYSGNTLTNDFAIPDFRTKGYKFCAQAFNEILNARIHPDESIKIKNLADLIQYESGKKLSSIVSKYNKKFLKINPGRCHYLAKNLTTCNGRKLLFDNATSTELKKASILDDILAAQKALVGERRYNLYPKRTNLEKVRLKMVEKLNKLGCDIKYNQKSISLPKTFSGVRSNGIDYKSDNLLIGLDPRIAEKIFFNTDSLYKHTHILPEIFHIFECDRTEITDKYYIVNYDEKHLSSRLTFFSNYTNQKDKTKSIVCVEQPVSKKSIYREKTDADSEVIFQELIEATGCQNLKKIDSLSIYIPTTYKVPLNNIESIYKEFKNNVLKGTKMDVTFPNIFSLTRKETIDELRASDIIKN